MLVVASNLCLHTCIKYVSSSNQNNPIFFPQIISLTSNRAVRRYIPSVSSLKNKKQKKTCFILQYSPSIIHSMQSLQNIELCRYLYIHVCFCLYVLLKKPKASPVACKLVYGVSVVPGHMINERLCSVLRKQVGFEFLISCDSGPGLLSWGAWLRKEVKVF